MYSSTLWNHVGDGRLRSRLRRGFGSVRDIHFECYQSLAGRTSRRRQRIPHDRRSQRGDGIFLCTDGEDIEELNEMFGPLCWQGYENDHGGFKKLMWCGITKEFNCNATSTRSKCGRDKGDGFHPPTNKKKRQEW